MTARATIAEARAFDSWRDYQEALQRAIAPLAQEQLRHRPIPGRRTPGEIAEHIVFGRALHLARILGEVAAPQLAPYQRWNEPSSPPRTAAEIVQGLAVTWQIIEERLTRGSSGDLLPEGEAEEFQTIWGPLDHDRPHAGQLSLLLRAIGMPGVEI